MDSWQQLPTYCLEATPPFSSENSAGPAGYSARHPPDIQLAPVSRISDSTLPPEDRILPRLLRALKHGLGLLPPGLEFPDVTRPLQRLNDKTSWVIEKESQIAYHLENLHEIAEDLTKSICRAFGQPNIETRIDSPKQSFSQVATFVVDSGAEQTTISFEMKQPNALFSHAGTTSGGLQTNSTLPRGKAKGAAALSIEVSESVP